MRLAEETGADSEVVGYFALFHEPGGVMRVEIAIMGEGASWQRSGEENCSI
jgi:hypothetical protein